MPPRRTPRPSSASDRSDLSVLADRLTPMDWQAHLDPALRAWLAQAFLECGADEGTVWLTDVRRQALVPIYNTGPHAARFVGSFRQPLRSGLISMVLATEQPFLENQVPGNKRQSRRLDRHLHVQTLALMAVPLSIGHVCRGVLSCVQLQPKSPHSPATPPGFRPRDLDSLLRTADLAGRLLHHALLMAPPQQPPHD